MEPSFDLSRRLAASVIAVPPLARTSDRRICGAENRRLIEYLERGGISTLLYGGNAVLYHVRLSEYAQLLSMLRDAVSQSTWVIPSVGPAFGTMMDQADMLIDFNFPTVMILPQKEIANQAGLATGIRLFAERLGKPIVLYLKHDRWLAPRAVQSLEDDGLISWVKYAVVRDDPAKDDYLREIAQVVDPNRIVSGIGEQPAIVHMRDFGVASFTSGCVCVAPKMSMRMLAAVAAKDYAAAELLRTRFQALEDLRNQIQPISVLHQAVAAAGIAETGPIQPMLGSLTADQAGLVAQASRELRLAEIEL
jgi:dihydrodipicolinate synthase/N-acetylneuraminate lyase